MSCSPQSRPSISWLVRIVALGALSGMFVTLPLWLNTRSYPLVPVFSALPELPSLLNAMLVICCFSSLVGLIVIPKWRAALASFVVIIVWLMLFDQTRIQTWMYQYIAILGGVFYFSTKQTSAGHDASGALSVARVVLASTYFWSGAQKINVWYVERVFPWVVEPFQNYLHISPGWITILAVLTPILELMIGIILCSQRFRKLAVLLTVGMHFLILIAVGPFGHGFETVIWPWNIAMIAFVVLLFWNTDFSIGGEISKLLNGYGLVVVLLFTIMPGFGFFQLWDPYLSAQLYAGIDSAAFVAIEPNRVSLLPKQVQTYVEQRDGKTQINVFRWAHGVIHTAPYPSLRVHQGVALSLCDLIPELTLSVYQPQRLSLKYRELSFDCDLLANR